MEKLYCLSILSLNMTKPIFIEKYLINSNYSADTITDILEGEDLNIEIGASHAFEYDGLKYLIHFVGSHEIFCVVSTKYYKNRLLAELVEELKFQYDSSIKSGKNTHTYLKTLGDKYNNPFAFDSILRTQNKINNVKSVMHQNIEMVLQNCVKLEDLEIRAQELSQTSGIFRGTARDLRRKMWWKNIKMKIYIALIVLTMIGIFTGILCAIYPPNQK